MVLKMSDVPERLQDWCISEEAQKAAISEWIDSIKLAANRDAILEKHPYNLYQYTSEDGNVKQKVLISNYTLNDDDTVSVLMNVTRDFNLLFFERTVFGVNMDLLTPICNMADMAELEKHLISYHPSLITHLEPVLRRLLDKYIPSWHESLVPEDAEPEERAKIIKMRMYIYLREELDRMAECLPPDAYEQALTLHEFQIAGQL